MSRFSPPQATPKLWSFLLLWLLIHAGVWAQDETESAAPSAPSAPSTPSVIFPTAEPAAPTSGGSGTASPLPSSTGATPPSGNSALGAGVKSSGPATAAPATLSVPGGYGFTPRLLTLGEGRFAQPPVKYTFSISQGYDDNVFASPTHPLKPSTTGTSTDTSNSSVSESKKREPIVIIGGPFGTKIVTIPEPKAIASGPTVEINPPVEPTKKTGSAVTNARAGMQVQLASPRTAFTMDLSVGALYYWDRPGGSTDYNGSLGLTYLHRISQRLTLSAQVDAVYQSQADFSRINTPTRDVVNGDYLSANAKLDLTYQFRPRLATVTTYSLAATLLNGDSNESNLYQHTFGESLRFSFSPRTTLVGEVRQGYSSYPSTPERNSSSSFLLVGADVAFSRRLSATGRIGEEFRSFEGSSTQTAPYLETTTSYVFSQNSTLQWNNRFGFEESPSATEQRLSYRTGLNVNEVLSSRLTASLGVAYNRVDTSALSGEGDSTIEQQLQGNFGLQFVVSRTLSLNANYTFTQLVSTTPGTDYRRNQVFLGASYSF